MRTPHYSVKQTSSSVPLIPGLYIIHWTMWTLTCLSRKFVRHRWSIQQLNIIIALGGHCQVSFRVPANLLGVLWPSSNTTASNLELTWWYKLNEFHSQQVRMAMCESVSHFSMGLNCSLYNCHQVALIAIKWASPLQYNMNMFKGPENYLPLLVLSSNQGPDKEW